jgi:hypothetical protein
VTLNHHVLNRSSSGQILPSWGRNSFGRAHILRNLEAVEGLKKANDEERGLVVGKLLSETDTGPGVERKEDEWIRNEIFLEPIVQPAIGIEFGRYVNYQ